MGTATSDVPIGRSAKAPTKHLIWNESGIRYWTKSYATAVAWCCIMTDYGTRMLEPLGRFESGRRESAACCNPKLFAGI